MAPRNLVLALGCVSAAVGCGGGEAHSGGAPASPSATTPESHAGVARRASRRTTGRAVAATTAVAAITPSPVHTLPPRCRQTGAQYFCGRTIHQPHYEGTTVVSVEKP
jgi:hypothetical protein